MQNTGIINAHRISSNGPPRPEDLTMQNPAILNIHRISSNAPPLTILNGHRISSNGPPLTILNAHRISSNGPSHMNNCCTKFEDVNRQDLRNMLRAPENSSRNGEDTKAKQAAIFAQQRKAAKVGIALKACNRVMDITHLLSNGPVHRAGKVRVGDIIKKVDGKVVPEPPNAEKESVLSFAAAARQAQQAGDYGEAYAQFVKEIEELVKILCKEENEDAKDVMRMDIQLLMHEIENMVVKAEADYICEVEDLVVDLTILFDKVANAEANKMAPPNALPESDAAIQSVRCNAAQLVLKEKKPRDGVSAPHLGYQLDFQESDAMDGAKVIWCLRTFYSRFNAVKVGHAAQIWNQMVNRHGHLALEELNKTLRGKYGQDLSYPSKENMATSVVTTAWGPESDVQQVHLVISDILNNKVGGKVLPEPPNADNKSVLSLVAAARQVEQAEDYGEELEAYAQFVSGIEELVKLVCNEQNLAATDVLRVDIQLLMHEVVAILALTHEVKNMFVKAEATSTHSRRVEDQKEMQERGSFSTPPSAAYTLAHSKPTSYTPSPSLPFSAVTEPALTTSSELKQEKTLRDITPPLAPCNLFDSKEAGVKKEKEGGVTLSEGGGFAASARVSSDFPCTPATLLVELQHAKTGKSFNDADERRVVKQYTKRTKHSGRSSSVDDYVWADDYVKRCGYVLSLGKGVIGPMTSR